MNRICYLFRLSFNLSLAGILFISPAYAHYPHDTHSFVELSPDYANDSTAFIASKQASSTNPVSALVTRNGGATWEFNAKGMDNLAKITSATASPSYDSDKTVILTSQGQGVYRTVDAGLSWNKFNKGLNNLNLHDSAAALDNTGVVTYFVSATNGGLYRNRSTQPTASWSQQLNNTIIVTAFALSPDFANDQTILAGGPDGSLYLSNDAGESFSLLNLLNGIGIISQIHFAEDYAISGEVFIGTSNGLYVSTDSLTTISSISSFSSDWISALILSPNYRSDATLFVTTPTQGVFKSTDRGQTWVLHETGVELVAQTTFHFHELNISNNFSNDGTLFLATFEGLFRSTDFGNTWIEMETRPPTLVMSAAMSPHFAQDRLILVSTYGGGMYVSEDAGQSWRVSSQGVSSPYGYQVAIVDNPDADPIMLSSHLNHLIISEDKGNSWVEKEIFDVLPGNCIASKMGVSPGFATDKTVYLGCRKEGIVVTHDAGESWSLVLNAQQLNGGVITSIALSPDYAQDHTLMYSEHRGYFGKSLDEGLSWQLAQNGLPTAGRWYGGRGLVFSPDYQNDRGIAAATERGVFGTGNAASAWSAIPVTSSKTPLGVIENIAISPDFSNDITILVSIRGKGLHRFDSDLNWQQVGAGDTGNRYDIQRVVISPDYANDDLIIGYGHDHLLRSTNHGDSFEAFDIPFVRHEDNRKQSVLYTGYWLKVENTEASGLSFRASRKAGHEVSLIFEGTGVRWIGVLANVLGIAEVYLDDVLVATVDQYSATPAWLQTLYEVKNLPLTTHKIRLVVTADKSQNALANWVILDGFDVIK